VAQPHVFQRGFQQFGNLVLGVSRVDTGEHGKVQSIEAGDQQFAGEADEFGCGDLADAPQRGGFLHSGENCIAFHPPIVNHRMKDGSSIIGTRPRSSRRRLGLHRSRPAIV
jgi:hypothetical protein